MPDLIDIQRHLYLEFGTNIIIKSQNEVNCIFKSLCTYIADKDANYGIHIFITVKILSAAITYSLGIIQVIDQQLLSYYLLITYIKNIRKGKLKL